MYHKQIVIAGMIIFIAIIILVGVLLFIKSIVLLALSLTFVSIFIAVPSAFIIYIIYLSKLRKTSKIERRYDEINRNGADK